MFNFFEIIKQNPAYYRQLAVGDMLMTEFNCPLETHKSAMWTDRDYIVYVVEGKKIWHTPGNRFELTKGNCVYVKKSAHLVEQFFDSRFCVIIFFLSDSFIRETLRSHFSEKQPPKTEDDQPAILPVQTNETLHAFFNSVAPYFLSPQETSKSLLELKFRELLLNIVGSHGNRHIAAYMNSLLVDSHTDKLRKIMEDNFCFNLSLEEFAMMCGRSLSAFKRDFEEAFHTSPGRWLMERRLQHAQLLFRTSSKSVSEVAFECGFENASHFSKSFKKHFGISPAEFKTAGTV